jgi:hypothetical protein
MDIIFDEIFKAVGYLFIAGVVYFAYKTAHDNAEGDKYKTVLWKGFLYCAGIALFASVIMGNPTCESQSDPIYGGCDQYADDGYEPTNKQREARFAYYMTLLYIPVVFGALDKREKK